MGIVKENLATKGFSGGLGDEFVYRQIKNRTHFAKRPKKRSVVTPNQEAARKRFQDGVYYAKAVLMDPAIREDYTTRAKEAGIASPYQAALQDFLKPLKIASIRTDGYLGVVGQPIFIVAADDFKIQSMTVTLQRADGTVIESGSAVKDSSGWIYLATQANATRAGTKVIVQAKDRPGKEATEEQIL